MWNRVFYLVDTHTARIVQVLAMFTITVVVVFALVDRANVTEANRQLIHDGLVERSAASKEREKLIDGQTELRARLRELRQQNERVVEFLRLQGINVPGSVLSGPSRTIIENHTNDNDNSDDDDSDSSPTSGSSNTPNTPTPTQTPDSRDIVDDVEDTIDGISGMLPDVLNQTEPLLGQP